jgi:hypothetical protein
MRRSAIFVAVPLVAVPVITAVMLVGGKVEQPGRPASDPTVGRTVCTEDVGCPQGFRRPLEC